MKKIALLNIESYSSSEAIVRFIKENHDKLAFVITTDIYSGKNGNILKQLVCNYRRSGFTFVLYLSCNFIFYFWLIYLSRLVTLITKRTRKKFTISEICSKYKIQHIKTSNINSKEIISELEKANLDLIIIYYFDQILREQIINLPKKGVINVHAALLPECKGLFPVLYSAIKNNKKFGITVHEIMDKSIDSGDIIIQKRINTINTGNSILTLGKIVNNEGVDLLNSVIYKFDLYLSKKRPQSNGSYFSFPSISDIQEASNRGFTLISLNEYMNDFF